MARLLSERVAHLKAEVVLGPATGGLILSQWLAHHLGVLSAFAEHDDQFKASDHSMRPAFVLKRHYNELLKGRRVLVIDDIINTGLSIRQTVDAARQAGAEVIATAAICTRGNATLKDLGSDQFFCLMEIKVPSWPAEL